MKIVIRKTVNGSGIYDEQGKRLGTIEGWAGSGKCRSVSGIDGERTFTVRKTRDGCMIEDGKGRFSRVSFSYGPDGGTGKQEFLFRPPMAQEAIVSFDFEGHDAAKDGMEDESLILRQSTDRRITLWQKGERIGEIRAAPLVRHEAVCDKTLSIPELAALYVVAVYLCHDDDIDII